MARRVRPEPEGNADLEFELDMLRWRLRLEGTPDGPRAGSPVTKEHLDRVRGKIAALPAAQRDAWQARLDEVLDEEAPGRRQAVARRGDGSNVRDLPPRPPQ